MAKKTEENKSLVSFEQSKKEIDSWLDFRKVSDSKKAVCVSSINRLIFGLMEGSLILNEDFSFTQKLKFEIGDTKELVYKPRLSIEEARARLNLINPGPNDDLGRTIAYTAALTGMNVAIISKLESEDFILADHISFFFMG